MQELKPRDMSLPDRVEVLERGLQRERNKRKILMGLMLEIMDKKNLKLTEIGHQAIEELEA